MAHKLHGQDRASTGRRPFVAGCTLAGVILGAVFAVVALLRRSKPLHPRGSVVSARVDLIGGVPELGEALGSAGTLEATARFSRSVGLPPPLPDIQGLALRWSGRAGPADVLLASTGTGPVSRYLLTARRRPFSGAFTSLMPYQAPSGAVLLAAFPRDDTRMLGLRWATPRGPWRDAGTITCLADPTSAPDVPIRFDPVLNSPDGLSAYAWTAQLRQYAYRWARRSWSQEATS